jgi:hypothetical protein
MVKHSCSIINSDCQINVRSLSPKLIAWGLKLACQDMQKRTVVLVFDRDSDENVSSIKDAVKADVKSAAGFFRCYGSTIFML